MKRLGLLLIAAGWLVAAQVWGQPDETGRAAARRLVEEADTAWDRGDWGGALNGFERANAIMHLPTLTLREAECLVKLGKLVEASERYVAASRATVPEGSADVVREAVKTAVKEAGALRERLPGLVIELSGGDPGGATLRIEGREIPSALWGARIPVNPGKCHVELSRGGKSVQRDVTLAERQELRLTLELPAPAAAGKPVAAPPAADRGAEVDTAGGSSQRTWGWVSLGLGGAGVVFGSVTGLMAGGKKSTLDGVCTDGDCPPTSAGDVDSYNGLRTMSTVGLGVGVVGVGAGLTLLLTAPAEPVAQQAGVTPWVGVGSAGVRGSF